MPRHTADSRSDSGRAPAAIFDERPLTPADLCTERLVRLQGPEDLIVFALPDRIQMTDVAELATARLLTARGARGGRALTLLTALNQWFVRVAVPVATDRILLPWAHVELRSAMVLIRAAAAGEPVCRSGIFGSFANALFVDSADASLLHTLVAMDAAEPNEAPVLHDIVWERVPGGWERAARAITENILRAPENLLPLRGSRLFLAGSVSEGRGDMAEALAFYHEAHRLDHPRANESAQRVRRAAGAAFRDSHPHIFSEIARGNRLYAVTYLRQAAEQFPVESDPLLAYALRGSGQIEEGLAACARALARDPNQADVLGHRWSYLFERGDVDAMLATAFEHLERFPSDPLAVKNVIHALRLAEHAEAALPFAHRYAALTEHLPLALREIFEILETLERQTELAAYLDDVLPHLPRPSAEVHVLAGECFIDVQRFDDAAVHLEAALRIAPESADAVLAYARLLARQDMIGESLDFIRTALADRTRIDRTDKRALLVTFGAELLRRRGDPVGALELFENQVSGDLVELSAEVGPFPALERAESLLALGRLDEAASVLGRLLKRYPSDPFVRELHDIVASEQRLR